MRPARVILNPEGPWDIPVDGFEVLQVTFAYPVDIVTYGPDGETVTIRIEGAFEFVDSEGTNRRFDASKNSWEELSVVLALRHDHLRSVHADETGALTVEFKSGRRIEASCTPGTRTGRSAAANSASSRSPETALPYLEGPGANDGASAMTEEQHSRIRCRCGDNL